MIHNLLGKLERVKQVSPNRWVASSPTRVDTTPSLSIRLTEDNRILMHDFGGSSVHEILSAVGMEITDLFPPRDEKVHAGKPTKERIAAIDLIKHLHPDLRLVLVAARMCVNGETIAERDMTILNETIERLTDGLAAGGYHE